MDNSITYSFSKKFLLPIYWAFLTYMLLKPGEENKEYWFMFSGIDKLIHLSIFAALGFFFNLSFPKTKYFTFIQIMLVYAFLSEIFQDEMHMGRAMETLDVIADFIGVTIGFFIFEKAKKYIF